MKRLFTKRVLAVSGGLALAGVLALTAGFRLGLGESAFGAEGRVVRADQGDSDEEMNAEAASFNISDFEYSLEGTTCVLEKYIGSAEEIRLPKKVTLASGTYTVTLATGKYSSPSSSVFMKSSVKTLSFEDGFVMPENCKALFLFAKINEYDFSNVDFSQVKSMKYMFYAAGTTYFDIDLSGKDLSHVEDMFGCFERSNLRSISLAGTNTKNVKNMGYMFSDCDLEEFDGRQLNYASCEDFHKMFSGCYYLTSVNFAGCKFPKVIDIDGMFEDDEVLETINFSSVTWNPETIRFSQVYGIFKDCYKLRRIDLNGFQAKTDLRLWFCNNESLQYLDLSGIDDIQAYGIFSGLEKLRYQGMTSLTTLKTPRTTQEEAKLPDIFVDESGKVYEYVPANLTHSLSLTLWKFVKHPSNVSTTNDVPVVLEAKTNAADDQVSYQWKVSTDGGSTWENVDSKYGGKTTKITLPVGTYKLGSKYRCFATYGTETYQSNVASLTLYSPMVSIQANPSSKSGYYGDKVLFSVKASGALLKYQWQYSTDGRTWKNSSAAGAKTDTLEITCASSNNNLQYRCVVSSGTISANSSAAKLTSKALILNHPASQTASIGNKVTFSVTAGGANRTYQWQFSSDGKTWMNSGATGAKTASISVTAGKSNNGLKYRCIVKNGSASETSSVATLTVKLQLSKQPVSKTAYYGDRVQFTTGSLVSGVTYQWQYSSNGSTWSNSTGTGAKTATLTITAGSGNNGLKYRCLVTYGTAKAYTSVATLTSKAIIVKQPTSISATVGSKVNFVVSCGGTNLSYQWQFSSDGKTWKDSGATGAKTASVSVTVGKTNNGVKYRCIVKNGTASATSSVATLTVKS